MKKAAKITVTALSAAAACGAAIYGVTHVLMDVAMNRQPPRLRKKKGGASRLPGDGRAVQVMLTPEGKKVEAFHRRCHRRIIAVI